MNLVLASFRDIHADPAARRHARRRTSLRLRLSGAVSAVLHATLLVSVMVGFHRSPPPEDAPEKLGAVELVLVQTKGAGIPAAPREPAQAAAVPVPPPPPPPDNAETDVALSVPPPPPPARAAPVPGVPKPPSAVPPVPAVQEAPVIRLGGTGDNTFAEAFESPQVIPASVDAKYHNRQPPYPPEAVLRGEQGAVDLLIHVSPDGLARGVDIAGSSGFQILDDTARDAVSLWHFLPAIKDGQPVPFDMLVRMHFKLN